MGRRKLIVSLEAAQELEIDKVAKRAVYYENGTPAQRAKLDAEEPDPPKPEDDSTGDSTDDTSTDDADANSTDDSSTDPVDDTDDSSDTKSDDGDKTSKDDDSEDPDAEPDDKTEEDAKDDDSDPVKDSEDNTDALNETVKGAKSLEALALVLEDSMRYGGITPACMAITSIALESTLKHIGFKDKNIKSFGLEDFDSFTDSVSSGYNTTKDVIGHISNILSSVWNAVDRSISFSIDILSRIAKKFHTGFSGYLKECGNIKEALRSIKNISNEDSKRYHNTDVIKRLHCGNVFDPLKSVTVLDTFAKAYFTNIRTSATASTKNIYSIIEAVRDSNFTAPNKIIRLPDLPEGVHPGSVSGYTAADSNLESYVYKDKLPGDTVFIAFYPNNDLNLEDLDAAQRESKFILGFDISSSNAPSDVEYLNYKKINSFVDKLEELCREGLSSSRVFYDFLESKKRLASELKKLEKLNGYEIDKHKEKNLDVKEYIRAISATLQRYDNTYIDGSSKIAELMIRTLKSGTKYASDSIKFYS